jgi:hypothetical protein
MPLGTSTRRGSSPPHDGQRTNRQEHGASPKLRIFAVTRSLLAGSELPKIYLLRRWVNRRRGYEIEGRGVCVCGVSVCEDCPRPSSTKGKYTVAHPQWSAHMPDGHFFSGRLGRQMRPIPPALIAYARTRR